MNAVGDAYDSMMVVGLFFCVCCTMSSLDSVSIKLISDFAHNTYNTMYNTMFIMSTCTYITCCTI